jgi:hypothetical protein
MIAAITPRRCRKAKSILTSFPFGLRTTSSATAIFEAEVVDDDSTPMRRGRGGFSDLTDDMGDFAIIQA